MLRITNPKKFFLWLVLLLLILGLLVWKLAWGSGDIQKSGELEIKSGESASVVWNNLKEGGFVDHTLPLKYYGWRLKAASKIQAGTYLFEKDEHVKEVMARLVTGDTTPDELTLTYPEGFTLQQIAERTAAKNIGTVDGFLAAASPAGFAEQFTFLKNIPSSRNLDGYLFPDTYQVFPDDTPADVMRRMLANFDSKFTPELRQEVEAQGRTLDEVVIMASIIEREVLSDDDMALVSGVLWKRLDDGIGLAADATVRYALNKWDDSLTVDDLALDSPYNTRKYRGLPPGPISNPGLRALLAAVRPEESEYYYYLSTPTGETVFSKTNDEHNANKVKYLR